MNDVSRFLAPPEDGPTVQFYLDGEVITATVGVSLAAAILALSGGFTRQTANGNERAPYCMMGVCFDCLVEADGKPNTQACMTPVRDGMTVKRQIGLRGLNGDSDV